MNRITKEQIKDYVSDLGEFETEHRKGSSFYASASHTFTGKDIAELADTEIDASELLGITVTLNGYWSDYDCCEWDDDEVVFTKAEKYEVFVPEVVIPAHYETKVREVDVDIKFD